MIEKVRHWQTNDMRLHETEEAAESHIVTTLENRVGSIVDEINKGLPPHHALGAAAKLALVNGLVGTVDRAKILMHILTMMLE